MSGTGWAIIITLLLEGLVVTVGIIDYRWRARKTRSSETKRNNH